MDLASKIAFMIYFWPHILLVVLTLIFIISIAVEIFQEVMK